MIKLTKTLHINNMNIWDDTTLVFDHDLFSTTYNNNNDNNNNDKIMIII